MSTQDMSSIEAREKMTSLVNSIKTGMLITALGNRPLSAIPMTTKQVDEDGNIWFLSRLDSDHNSHIVLDADVQLLYSDPADKEFISIYGKAAINTQQERLKELYSQADNTWFTGLEDPVLTAIKVIPEEAYYWDSKQAKKINIFKKGLEAITGEGEQDLQEEIGKKGKLNL